jgi:hypothetical protein
MAKAKKNALVETLSGRVGKLVFKQYGDKTVVCKWPEHDPDRTPTPGEARQHSRIKDAAARAKSILATEAGQAYYQAARERLGKHSAYHTAVHDYFGAPTIEAVEGDGDCRLLMQVSDNVGVREVRVVISGEAAVAQPLEETPCTLWEYQLEEGHSGEAIAIEAEDWIGNVTRWEGHIPLNSQQ